MKRIKESPLDEALDDAGMTGAALAEELGVTVSEVSRWRRGRVTPWPQMQARIAEILSKASGCEVGVDRLWPSEDA